MPVVIANRAHRFVQATLEAAGLTEDEARICADAAVFADLRGTDTHGIVYIVPRTLQSICQGKTVAGTQPITLRESGPTALVRGNGLAGPVLGQYAMDMAIVRAQRHGVGVVNTYNGNPLGLLGYYPSLASARGLIGLAMANTPPAVAPYGAGSRVFGTNPFAYAVPTTDAGPILFDAASSAAASGKLARIRRRGEKLPLGWMIGPNGEPITDPWQAENGALLPFGGHKGSAIALLIHLLTGVLAGATIGGEPTHDYPDESIRGQSALFLVIDPSFFSSRDRFLELVDRQIARLHEATPLPGIARVRVPGERGWQEAEHRQRHGIPIADEDWAVVLDALVQSGLDVSSLLAELEPISDT